MQEAIDNMTVETGIGTAGQYYQGLGCNHLGKSFVSYGGILTCFVVPCRYFDVGMSSDIDGMYAEYKRKTDSFVLDNMLGKPTLCKDCYQLQHGTWETKPQINTVNISSDPDDFCNSKCVYCVKYPKPSNDIIRKREMYILSAAEYFTAKANGEPLQLHISAGEISVSSYCDEIMKLIAENENLYAVLSTNAIVFKESIADALATKRVELIISLDSGTPETMIKVRGLDCFDSSVSTCMKYAQCLQRKTMLSMKYIILEEMNDNETDIRQFLDIVKRIGCVAELSVNCHYLGKKDLSEHGLEMCYLFMRICSEHALAFRYVDYYFNEKDRFAIEKYRQKLQL